MTSSVYCNQRHLLRFKHSVLTHLGCDAVPATRGLELSDVLPDHVIATVPENLLCRVITPHNLRWRL